MPPLLLGHRGAPTAHPENTLDAFQAALDAGLDGVEWDVRRLKDGTLVLHHDVHLTDGRLLTQLLPQDLPKHIPTLAAGLDWASQTGAYINVELKFESFWPDDRVRRTLLEIQQHHLGHKAIISSFMPTFLWTARKIAPDIPRALLIHRRYPLILHSVMRWTGCQTLHPIHTVLDEEFMQQAKRAGWKINAWTVNDTNEIQRLTQLGVDGLIGDVPKVLLEAKKYRFQSKENG